MSQVEKIIVQCPSCRQKLRVPLLSQKIMVVKCPKGCAGFQFNLEKYKFRKRLIKGSLFILTFFILVLDLGLPFTIMPFIGREQELMYGKSLKAREAMYLLEETNLKKQYDEEIQSTNKDELKKKAMVRFLKELEERKNYDDKYAITPREKAQLEMRALSKDKSRPVEEIIRSLAAKAAPKNSEISVSTTTNGFILDIDFDMSTLSSGEKGTRTSHRDLGSLKNEVRRLICKVTNDVYQFLPQEINLESIKIGCKHLVDRISQDFGLASSSGEENIVIYKTELKKNNFKDLSHNPFLDIYSVEKYLNVVSDDFPNLRLSNSQ